LGFPVCRVFAQISLRRQLLLCISCAASSSSWRVPRRFGRASRTAPQALGRAQEMLAGCHLPHTALRNLEPPNVTCFFDHGWTVASDESAMTKLAHTPCNLNRCIIGMRSLVARVGLGCACSLRDKKASMGRVLLGCVVWLARLHRSAKSAILTPPSWANCMLFWGRRLMHDAAMSIQVRVKWGERHG
jgi:hypothetical protein